MVTGCVPGLVRPSRRSPGYGPRFGRGGPSPAGAEQREIQSEPFLASSKIMSAAMVAGPCGTPW